MNRLTPGLLDRYYEFLRDVGLGDRVSREAYERAVSSFHEERFGPDPGVPLDSHDGRGAAFELLAAHGLAFQTDWHWQPRSLIREHLAPILPDLGDEIEVHELEDGRRRWHVRGRLLGRPFDVRVDTALPADFLDAIEPIVTETRGLRFLGFATFSDSHAFVLIPAGRYDQLEGHPLLGWHESTHHPVNQAMAAYFLESRGLEDRSGEPPAPEARRSGPLGWLRRRAAGS